MMKNFIIIACLIIGISSSPLLIAMERMQISEEEGKKLQKQEQTLEKEAGLQNPRKSTSAILLEIKNKTPIQYNLVSRKKTIEPIVQPRSTWSNHVNLYQITNALSAFEGILKDAKANTNKALISITLTKDELNTHTLFADVVLDRDSEQNSPVSQELNDEENHKVVITIAENPYDSSAAIQPYERKSSKGSLLQRVISRSGMNKN